MKIYRIIRSDEILPISVRKIVNAKIHFLVERYSEYSEIFIYTLLSRVSHYSLLHASLILVNPVVTSGIWSMIKLSRPLFSFIRQMRGFLWIK